MGVLVATIGLMVASVESTGQLWWIFPAGGFAIALAGFYLIYRFAGRDYFG